MTVDNIMKRNNNMKEILKGIRPEMQVEKTSIRKWVITSRVINDRMPARALLLNGHVM